MRRSETRLLSVFAAAALLALTGGCFSSGDPAEPDPPDPTYPFPGTAEQLMANFKQAYDLMNAARYAEALHEDFLFIFQDGSSAAPPSGVFTREEDLQSTTRMFRGEQGQDLDGIVKPGVRDIEFTQLERLTDWEDVDGDDLYFPGAMRALYDVRIVFILDTESLNTITIDCQQLFYVEPVTEPVDGGGTRERYYLVGQQDL
ncbi:MAG: hypothetical protein IPM94_00150 [bacterium]|nr:hypothetical protein [bacterium]